MECKNLFAISFNEKTVFMLVILTVLPNILGMFNITTIFGFKIHFFQYAVFIAAALYGPVGGAISGGVGSMVSAFAMHNPYLVIGNIILGFMAGFFIRKGWGVLRAVLVAFALQLPWLLVSDVYLMGMPYPIVAMLVIALLASNIVWAIVTAYTYKPIKQVAS